MALNLAMTSCSDLISLIMATTWSGGDCSVLTPEIKTNRNCFKQIQYHYKVTGISIDKSKQITITC